VDVTGDDMSDILLMAFCLMVIVIVFFLTIKLF
jgi:hypothetical protein